jgi:hypothetical protein
MTPHQLAEIIRRAHAIGERRENQVGIENYPREWQDMIVAALEAFGAAQAGREAPGWIDAAALQSAREIAAITWTYTSKVAAIQGIVAREMMRTALEGAAQAPLAYRLDHPTRGIELFICKPSEDWAGRGWKVTPLYASPVPSTWQPIETAPKDGTIFLAVQRTWWTPVNGDHRWVNSCVFESRWLFENEAFWDGDHSPTHWAPLPTFASTVPSTQVKPLSVCSRCGGKDPDCYICGTVVASTEGK